MKVKDSFLSNKSLNFGDESKVVIRKDNSQKKGVIDNLFGWIVNKRIRRTSQKANSGSSMLY